MALSILLTVLFSSETAILQQNKMFILLLLLPYYYYYYYNCFIKENLKAASELIFEHKMHYYQAQQPSCS